jgi:serine/threonine protein kinase
MRFAQYELGTIIGRGGAGTVYSATAPAGNAVAVKLLTKLAGTARERFERETRLHAQLGERDGFVPLLDSGTHDGIPFLVMPLVTGGTLRKRLEQGPLDLDDALELGIVLARALGRAHALGIVHRDVKPDNVLYTVDGRPLLSDLGLAKHYDSSAKGASASVALSQTDAFRGTAAYAAPEQIEDARRADARSDVFALGAVLYECLAGRPAIVATGVMELLAAALDARHEPLRKLAPQAPAWIVKLIERALAKDPARRFAHGEELALALERGPTRSGKGLLVGVTLAMLGAAGARGAR